MPYPRSAASCSNDSHLLLSRFIDSSWTPPVARPRKWETELLREEERRKSSRNGNRRPGRRRLIELHTSLTIARPSIGIWNCKYPTRSLGESVPQDIFRVDNRDRPSKEAAHGLPRSIYLTTCDIDIAAANRHSVTIIFRFFRNFQFCAMLALLQRFLVNSFLHVVTSGITLAKFLRCAHINSIHMQLSMQFSLLHKNRTYISEECIYQPDSIASASFERLAREFCQSDWKMARQER